jgi:hypothetical protein
MGEKANLKLIGAGFGRTGTDSMRTALEMLGFGPCHHMRALVDDPARKADWQRCIEAGEMDWDVLLGGFRSSIDWPSARYWPELAEQFAQAKVLLTWRTAQSWYASMEKTIIPSVAGMLERGETSPGCLTLLEELNGRPWKKASFIAAYEENVEKVKATIPADRLLVHKLGDGWDPLCAFLGVAVPDQPFPRSNDADAFHKWVKIAS